MTVVEIFYLITLLAVLPVLSKFLYPNFAIISLSLSSTLCIEHKAQGPAFGIGFIFSIYFDVPAPKLVTPAELDGRATMMKKRYKSLKGGFSTQYVVYYNFSQ